MDNDTVRELGSIGGGRIWCAQDPQEAAPAVAHTDLALKVTDAATNLALGLLRERNDVTPRHEALVRAMAATTVDSVLGRLPGRYAIVAPVGAAKTTTLACVARAVELHAPDDVGMLILQERVAAGAETIERLMVDRLGMNGRSIAHVFRRDAEGNAGVEAEDAVDSRFVVATHARAKMRSIVPLLTYRGRTRAALVDEVLYAGHGSGSTVRATKSLLGWLLGFDDHPHLRDLAEWAEIVRGELREAVASLRAAMPESAKFHDGYVKLTAPYAGRAGYWTSSLNGKGGRKVVRGARTERSEQNIAGDAVRLIESLATSPETRLVVKATNEEDGGILQHRRTLPPEMRNVLVFDAGAEIDPLLRFDDGLKLAHKTLPHFAKARQPEKVKRWDRVQLHWLKAPGGKDRIRKTFLGEERPWPTRVAAEFIVKMFGKREGPVLVVHFKDDSRMRIAERLRGELEARGFDWGRVKLTTWGQADASNAFQECIGGVLLGVLRLPKMDLQAMALAQTSDANLRPLPTPSETTGIDMAQTAARVYQAIGRCRSRQNESDGIAKSSKWLAINWEREPLEIAAEKLMPGAELLDWSVPRYVSEALQRSRKERRERDAEKRQRQARGSRRETQVDKAARRLFRYLSGVAEHGAERLREEVRSKGELREVAGLKDTPGGERAFRRAMREIEEDLGELGVDVERYRVVVPDWTEGFRED